MRSFSASSETAEERALCIRDDARLTSRQALSVPLLTKGSRRSDSDGRGGSADLRCPEFYARWVTKRKALSFVACAKSVEGSRRLPKALQQEASQWNHERRSSESENAAYPPRKDNTAAFRQQHYRARSEECE